MIKNKYVLNWVSEVKNLVEPNSVIWLDGSKKQTEELRKDSCKSGELIKLNENFLPGCYLHRSNPNDVARVESKTFICCEKKEDVGFTNNWHEPNAMLDKISKIAKGSYKNRKMYVIPFSMGHVGSKFSKLGIEITDSVYVALNMLIMTRVNNKVYEIFESSDNNWTKCLHCSCNCDEDNRYVCHFPEKNMVFSVNSSYGGNALLGKKCLALRLASYMGKKEGWLAEHMLILEIKTPYIDKAKYICAAFPSGCGKTNLAMLKPGKTFEEKGYKIKCVGDDIAWLRVVSNSDSSGKILRAINPENGFFGVGIGTNEKTNPNALKTASRDTIFTNVAYNTENGTVWWEDLSEKIPKKILDWKGEEFKKNSWMAHPNSRFTSPAVNCPCLSSEFENPDGVPISAVIFGGRRAKFTPLVLQSKNWVHGVFLGMAMSSETTAAASGKVGVLRHDPFGMIPFCGYNIFDYFNHWLEIGKTLNENAPKIFNVNWFRTDDNGDFIWPGFSENLRVLDWIIKRCENKVSAKETTYGFVPKISDLNVENLNIDEKKLISILEDDKILWEKEIKETENFYEKNGGKIPDEIKNYSPPLFKKSQL
ncbi:MAG: phosphoenolpyruvate carboxykinase (GTP) [Oscillospiraceae bacterium]|jgi:phosphoenolpyruvate carboxykinase (GTP)|nr:phosphoenolpyruvate carboxykinase (GTP) [Oscillospiraceae bacterium]